MAEACDRIYLQDLRVACIIGTGEQERRRAQEIGIDVCLHLDLEEPGRSDRLEDTVDYSYLAREITAMAESSSFRLLERLAEEIAALGLANPKVERVEVRVIKPHALPRGRAAVVEILRDRSSSKRPMGFGRFV
ncbi:MAG: dihydroneopterin aldolase [Spirochaetaceae bacterium]|nr:MAG: dihydroneopterin aldolase [Spirochaetaceae bacterium]